ncbi:MFS transporter [Gordonia liuliyuniae]|uniref:MFS transporter n=1 Tax=Gordonia liuliyuniae TaxID=2911517 RepID=A0ABS9ITZ5_9ACTN|nr:MFS transporter [Gordonia liuliyuniae]MCF8589040.1 MFS transporter [Gordonia liuliyuniae]
MSWTDRADEVSVTGAYRQSTLPVVFVLAAVQFTIIVDETAIALLAPSVARDLDLGDQARHLLVTPFAAAFVVMLPGTVVALRRVDPRRALPWAASAFAVSAAAGALTPTAASLIAARAMQGATAAVTTTCVLAALHLATANASTRARDFAVFSTVSGAGAIAALVVAAPLATVSWRWCFWAVGVAATVCTIGWLVASQPRADRGVGLRSARLSTTNGGLFGYAAIVAANAILAASVITVSFALQQDHGWTPVAAGLGFLPLNAAAAAGAITVARGSSTPPGVRRLLVCAFAALAVGCAALAGAPGTSTAIIVATVPIGFGVGVAFPLVNGHILAGRGDETLNRAAGLGMAQQIGLGIGALAAAAHSDLTLVILAGMVAAAVATTVVWTRRR